MIRSTSRAIPAAEVAIAGIDAGDLGRSLCRTVRARHVFVLEHGGQVGGSVISTVGIGQPLDPRVFHAGNLLLHLCSTLLLFAILRRLVHDNLPALVVLLFGLHPLTVESVAWVTETKGLLATLLSLLAIWLYFQFIADAADRPSPWNLSLAAAGIYALATVAFCLAILSKPLAVVAQRSALCYRSSSFVCPGNECCSRCCLGSC